MSTFLAGIKLKNFCGYKDSAFSFINLETEQIRKFCVFFGPNGTGKSSVLNAISLIGNPYIYKSKDTELLFRKLIYQTDYDPTYSFINKLKLSETMKIEGIFDDSDGYKNIVITNDGLLASDLKEKPKGYVYYIDADNPINMSKFQVPFERKDLFLDMAKCIYGFDCEFTNCIEEDMIDEDGNEITVEIFTDFIIKKGEVKVHFKSMSDGERKIATLLNALCDPLNVDILDIILIDNLEMHVYFKRHAAMVNKLVENFPNKQFIVTTHSETLIRHVRETMGEDHLFDLEYIQ